MEIPVDVKRTILQEKMELYRNTYYSHQIDAQIGQDIGDERMVKAATDNMHKAQQCLDALERMLNELMVSATSTEADDGQNHSD